MAARLRILLSWLAGLCFVSQAALAESPQQFAAIGDLPLVSGDHLVNPARGKALAEAVGARYAEIHSNCGHIGSSCEAWKVEAIVNAFLQEH